MSFFNVDEAPERKGFGVLPAGIYYVAIEDATYHENKNQTGWYVKVQLEVLNDQFSNRRLFCNFNLTHSNPKAAEIGQAEFAELLKAISIQVLNDPKDLVTLVGKTLNVKLGIKKGNRGDENNVVEYISRTVNETTRTVTSHGADQQPPVTTPQAENTWQPTPDQGNTPF